MHKIYCNDDPGISKMITSEQFQMFCALGMSDKRQLIASWVPGWRSYVSWSLASNDPGYDGMNGLLTVENQHDPKMGGSNPKVGDIPENWMDDVKIMKR